MASFKPWEIFKGRARKMTKWTNKIKEENSNTCCLCGHEKDKRVLHLHHVDPSEKLGQVGSFSLESKARREAQKCILVCGNCHTEIHCGLHEESLILSLPRAVSLEEIIQEVEEDPAKKKMGRPGKLSDKIKNVQIIEKIVYRDVSNLDNFRSTLKTNTLLKVRNILLSRPKQKTDFKLCALFLELLLDFDIVIEPNIVEALKRERRTASIELIGEALRIQENHRIFRDLAFS